MLPYTKEDFKGFKKLVKNYEIALAQNNIKDPKDYSVDLLVYLKQQIEKYEDSLGDKTQEYNEATQRG